MIKSQARKSATLLAHELNLLRLPVDMPQSDPLAKVVVFPKIQREIDAKLRVFVSLGARLANPVGQIDRCGRRWATQLIVVIAKKLQDYECNDHEQIASLDEIDDCLANAEYISEWIDQHRVLQSSAIEQLVELEYPILINEDWLKNNSVFYSEIQATYL